MMAKDVEQLKAEAGIAAAAFVKEGMKVGLGTGSTVKYTVIELGRRVAEGLNIVGVPTSIATRDLALEVGIPLIELSEVEGLDIVIDGADEFDPEFQLIKGGGGALLREKIVAQASNAMIVVADERKQVQTLGAFSIPIEVTPFSWQETRRQIENILKCQVVLRSGDVEKLGDVEIEGGAFATDNGNLILDAQCGATIDNPIATEKTLQGLAGVCEVGLFNNICDMVILAGNDGIKTLTKSDGRLSS